ncbi:MAG TPA: 2-oxoacid:acceptor oxidoreductase subunit alpha [bacterium]|jgi:2-oxoglutarate ferredoxin oxidoreductase subunit alpha|nr:2-oxoacid:acceptor oxidoreductase subunit alpha [bacterium]HNT65049.1 2-oxoacid:acceptor oxidoreductase subunit alpha [bacterium]HOX84456.1 2-oxoacid:acceptor oxidoreductase subunit alpha [bacterium]HPG45947.1 2-oxoacid:acceptor oxidoreductase subunit alpha [bacterium]HPM97769.1 2-oxoacid:acceptor oxidoreductase subunit alpha [bacterium]
MSEKDSTNRVQVLSGNEACAMGALAADMRFYAGYPITPSSEIAEVLSLELPKTGGVFIQMEDEIASMGAIIGASLAGSKSMTATSGPGFSLMQENIGYASMAEVPCVIVNVMRGGPSTGLPTMPAQADVMQARWGTHGDHPIIAIAPYSVGETFDLTIRAFNLAEKFRTPVILLMDEILGHVNEKVVFPRSEEIQVVKRNRPGVAPQNYLPYANTESGVPPMVSFGEGYRYHVTGLAHDETGFPTNKAQDIERLLLRLNNKLERNRDQIIDYATDQFEDAEIGILSYGSSARSARHAVFLARQKGIKAGLFRLKTIWPFAGQEIADHTARLKAWVVPEMNLGQIAHEVEWAVGRSVPVHRINRVDGNPINPLEILAKIEEIC